MLARPSQLPPPGNWRTWLLLGGRGGGKSRSAAEFVRSEVESGNVTSIGLVSRTMNSTLSNMVEAEKSGLLACCPPWNKPVYEASRELVRWPNDRAIAKLFGAEKIDLLRGPNFQLCWLDEAASIENIEELWDVLQMALRIPGANGTPARCVVTTTPRPKKWLRDLANDPSTAVTVCRTLDNATNLDAATVRHLVRKYGGTTLGRQELDAEILDNIEGALWQRRWIDAARVSEAPPLARVVTAIDPSVGGSAETGIVTVGRAENGELYVLADNSLKSAPEVWAQRAVTAYELHQADALVAEANQGGALIQSMMQALGFSAPIKLVHASKGKSTRAEPVALLYEQSRVHHVGAFPQLEDQLCGWVPGEGASPDRLDALVWAVTELALGPRRVAPPWLIAARERQTDMRNLVLNIMPR